MTVWAPETSAAHIDAVPRVTTSKSNGKITQPAQNRSCRKWRILKWLPNLHMQQATDRKRVQKEQALDHKMNTSSHTMTKRQKCGQARHKESTNKKSIEPQTKTKTTKDAKKEYNHLPNDCHTHQVTRVRHIASLNSKSRAGRHKSSLIWSGIQVRRTEVTDTQKLTQPKNT